MNSWCVISMLRKHGDSLNKKMETELLLLLSSDGRNDVVLQQAYRLEVWKTSLLAAATGTSSERHVVSAWNSLHRVSLKIA